jgi:hypothetical protein
MTRIKNNPGRTLATPDMRLPRSRLHEPHIPRFGVQVKGISEIRRDSLEKNIGRSLQPTLSLTHLTARNLRFLSQRK